MTQPERPPLILASQSPRRLELLAQLGLACEVLPADIDETPMPGETPDALVRRLALGKGAAIRARAAEDPRPATDARCVRRDATLFTTKGEDADMAGGGWGDRRARSEVKCATLRGSSRQLLYNTFGTFVELESRHQTLLSLSVLSMATHAGATCT